MVFGYGPSQNARISLDVACAYHFEVKYLGLPSQIPAVPFLSIFRIEIHHPGRSVEELGVPHLTERVEIQSLTLDLMFLRSFGSCEFPCIGS